MVPALHCSCAQASSCFLPHEPRPCQAALEISQPSVRSAVGGCAARVNGCGTPWLRRPRIWSATEPLPEWLRASAFVCHADAHEANAIGCEYFGLHAVR